MDSAKKISQFKRLLSQAEEIRDSDRDDSAFRIWKNNVERTLIRIFGLKSPEVEQFRDLRCLYQGYFVGNGKDFSSSYRECFDRDLNVLGSSVKGYIEELELEVKALAGTSSDAAIRRVFISHSSCDAFFVEELVDFLELIGLPGESIFCSSLAGYGIDLGANFLDAIREELRNDTMVLFVLTHNFFASPVCLCEMGAVWVQTKDHIPLIVPPFDFSDAKGVIPLTEGFRLNDALKLNLFKTKIETVFGLQSAMSQSTWERKRDRVIARINKQIEASTPS